MAPSFYWMFIAHFEATTPITFLIEGQNVVISVEGVPLFLSCRQFPISLELVCIECATRELPVEIDCVTECIGDCANCR